MHTVKSYIFSINKTTCSSIYLLFYLSDVYVCGCALYAFQLLLKREFFVFFFLSSFLDFFVGRILLSLYLYLTNKSLDLFLSFVECDYCIDCLVSICSWNIRVYWMAMMRKRFKFLIEHFQLRFFTFILPFMWRVCFDFKPPNDFLQSASTVYNIYTFWFQFIHR